MKVDNLTSVGATAPKRSVKKNGAADGEFSKALAEEEVESSSVGTTRAPAPSDALLSLQEVPDAVARNARARRQGEDLLDRLDELRLALLTGRLSPARIEGFLTLELEKVFDTVETTPFAIKCDVHPWMNAWTAVFDHPYFSVTSNDGSFTIENLPAGTYDVEIWHERLGTQTSSVTVGENASASVDFVMQVPS